MKSVRISNGILLKAGATVVDVEIPHAAYVPTVYLHLSCGEIAAYHARTLETRPDDYTPNVRTRLRMAGYVLAEDAVRAARGRAVIASDQEALPFRGKGLLDNVSAEALAASDLAEHRATWVEPVSTTFAGCEIFELPPATMSGKPMNKKTNSPPLS